MFNKNPLISGEITSPTNLLARRLYFIQGSLSDLMNELESRALTADVIQIKINEVLDELKKARRIKLL